MYKQKESYEVKTNRVNEAYSKKMEETYLYHTKSIAILDQPPWHNCRI